MGSQMKFSTSSAARSRPDRTCHQYALAEEIEIMLRLTEAAGCPKAASAAASANASRTALRSSGDKESYSALSSASSRRASSSVHAGTRVCGVLSSDS